MHNEGNMWFPSYPINCRRDRPEIFLTKGAVITTKPMHTVVERFGSDEAGHCSYDNVLCDVMFCGRAVIVLMVSMKCLYIP